MSSGFFSISDDGRLVDVSEVAFPSEDTLQELVARHPRLLSGDEGPSGGLTNWLLVAREMGIPSEENQADRWSVDHLFLDREGVPTLVEVKRSSDSRIRREVVGQMLDYAANASIFWPMETIRDSFRTTCDGRSLNPDEVIAEFLGTETEPDLFWERVKTNLQAGKLRLVFLADELPVELRRVIEFLNRQMDPTEVLGIEIKQYGAEGFQALTSRTIGRTADIVKRTVSVGPRWDEEAFYRAIAERGGQDDQTVAQRLLDWARRRSLRLDWGRGRVLGSFYPVLDFGDAWYPLFGTWTDSTVEIQFSTLQRRTAFEDEQRRLELLRRLNEIPSVQIEVSRVTGLPKIPFAALQPEGHLDKFLEAIEWAIKVIETDPGSPS